MTSVEHTSSIPPQALRERVTGTSDSDWFDQSGARTVDEWSRALASQGATFNDFQSIIDFGCGCGRALRHLKKRISPSQKLIGLDPDEEAIAWVSQNVSGVSAYRMDEWPPAQTVSTGSIDLILAHSVFTHLPEDVQFAWLADLARMLKSGGLLVASIHGAKVVNEYARSLIDLNRPDDSAHFSSHMKSNGFYHVVGKNAFEGPLTSYYGSAFHDISYVCNRWTVDFEIKAWFPIFALNHQDVLVLRRR